jgi:predicted hotdog family 3-hydroxylacyl-ACP dehydratase
VLGRDWIAARIPHRGGMCLLDGVSDWSAAHVRCVAVSHRLPENPLRSDGRLGAACGIEYAAQAMAVHGALLAGTGGEPAQGYIASVRDVALHVGRLDDLAGPLTVECERLAGDERQVLYRFRLLAGERLLVEGRAAVVLDGQAR